MKLFVYGTLMEGQCNHDYFFPQERTVKAARLKGRLYDTGSFPVLSLDPEGDFVYGQLISFDDDNDKWLTKLDRLEGFSGRKDDLYTRVLTTVNTEEGSEKAWVYVMDINKARLYEYLPSGQWNQ